MENQDIKEINKVFIKSTETEVLGIKWVTFKGFGSSEDEGNPTLCLHVLLKEGREVYVPVYENTGYSIECKEYGKNKTLVFH